MFSHSVMSDSLWPHGLQHTRPPVLHYLPEFAQIHVHWVGDAIQSSHPPLSPSPFAFILPASGFFPMNQLFTLGGQIIGVSTSASVLPMNIQGWFPLGLTDLNFLLSRDSRVIPSTIVWKHEFLSSQHYLWFHSHIRTTTRKTIAFTTQTFVSKVMALLFNTLSRFVIAFLLRSKHLLMSWLQSQSAVILESKKIKSVTVSIVPPSCHEVMGLHAVILVFWCWVLSQLFHSPLSPSSRGSLVALRFLWSSVIFLWNSVVCISEVVDTSAGNLDFSLWFLQPRNLHDVLCIEFKSVTLDTTDLLLSRFEPVHSSMSNSNCCFLTCIQVSQEAGKVVCISISWRIFHSLLWSTQSKAFM